MAYSRRHRRVRVVRRTHTLHTYYIAYLIKMSVAVRYPFSYIFICEANKNIDQAKDVRAQARENFGV